MSRNTIYDSADGGLSPVQRAEVIAVYFADVGHSIPRRFRVQILWDSKRRFAEFGDDQPLAGYLRSVRCRPVDDAQGRFARTQTLAPDWWPRQLPATATAFRSDELDALLFHADGQIYFHQIRRNGQSPGQPVPGEPVPPDM